MKKSHQPLMTAEQHRATGWSIFVALEQLGNPIGHALWTIKPARLKHQTLQRRDQLQHSLDNLRDYLEVKIAARDLDPGTALNLYYPGRTESASKTLTCVDVQLAQAFAAGVKAKTKPDGRLGPPRFTIIDFMAISDFLDTAVASKVELALNIISAEITDRRVRGAIQLLVQAVTASRLNLSEALRSTAKSLLLNQEGHSQVFKTFLTAGVE